jgi:DNA mismatch repair ATPase MutL
MADSDTALQQTISNLIAKIDERMKPIQDDMRMVNALCAHAKLPPHYRDVEVHSSKRSFAIHRDQYVGKAMATAVREFLEMRGPSDRGGMGAATVNEIYEALIAGGYKPDTEDELNAKRGLRIALTKNSQTFYRVSQRGDAAGTYGLLEWYPNAKPQESDDDVPVKRKRGRPPKAKKQKRGRPPGKTAAAKNADDKPESKKATASADNIVDLKPEAAKQKPATAA